MVSRTPRKAPSPSPDHTSPDAPRLHVSATAIHIFGYPSDQGHGVGVIALEDATAADFQFLLLDRTSPGPRTRLQDAAAENKFCRRLLRVGGRRWESLDRFWLVLDAIAHDDLALEHIEDGTAAKPTSSERRWVSVAWPSEGGVCVAGIPRRLPELGDYDEQSAEEDLILDQRAILRLALNMDEKAELLVDVFRGKLCRSLQEVDGSIIRKEDLPDSSL